MRLNAKKFSALYSAITNNWQVDIEEFEFKIKNLTISGYDGVLKQRYQQLNGTEVLFDLIEDWLIILSWMKLTKKQLYDISNPDQPRNLSKTVTVK